MTAGPTPTRTSSDPSGPADSGWAAAAGSAAVAGLGPFWLVRHFGRYRDGARADGSGSTLMPIRLVLRALAFGVVAFSLPGLKDPIPGNVGPLLLLPFLVRRPQHEAGITPRAIPQASAT